MAEAPARTVGAIVDATSAYLAGKSVDGPGRAAALLMARILRCSPLDVKLRADRVLDEPHVAAMRRGMKRVASGEPVQYVLGEWDFMGHTFSVDRRALIPRPETEVLVRQVLDHDPLWVDRKPVVLEVGTGSGCVIVSLALARADAYYAATDVSEEALELARRNADRLGMSDRVAFVPGELADAVDPETVDALVANPPYIPSGDIDSLPRHIRDHEPRVALDGGPDGTAILSDIIQDAGFVLTPGGLLFLEIGADQAERVEALLESAGFRDTKITRDLSGRDRVASAVLAD